MIHPADFFQHFPAKQDTPTRAATISRLLAESAGQVIEVDYGLLMESRAPHRGEAAMNFMVKCGNPTPRSPIFEAHYDVANARSENCLDNTASVCHLLALAYNTNFNGYLAFCDGEELVDFENSGARYLGETLFDDNGMFGTHDRLVFALELTAYGDAIWCDHRGHAKTYNIPFKRCPFSDAEVLRRWGVQAACLCMLPQAEMGDQYPKTWRHCHQSSDKFALANRDDMTRMQEWLLAASAR